MCPRHPCPGGCVDDATRLICPERVACGAAIILLRVSADEVQDRARLTPQRRGVVLIIRSAFVSAWALLAAPSFAQDIIVIGDSIMDWNGQDSIPAGLSQELGVPVDDRSVAGAQISAAPWDRLQGLDIRAQLGEDRPDVLVMTGGGNDLGEACRCEEGCAAEVDVLLAEDGEGELGGFLQEVVADGTHVFVLGYADPPTGGNEFSGCIPHLRTLAERLEAIPGVTLVPVHNAIDPADSTLYDSDRVHPSVRGSSVMADLLADAIANAR